MSSNAAAGVSDSRAASARVCSSRRRREMRASVRRCSPVARFGPTTPKMISTGLAVDGVEVDAPRDRAASAAGLRLRGIERAVRDRDAVADAGALQVARARASRLLDVVARSTASAGDSISASRRSASALLCTKLPSTSTRMRSTFRMSESRILFVARTRDSGPIISVLLGGSLRGSLRFRRLGGAS